MGNSTALDRLFAPTEKDNSTTQKDNSTTQKDNSTTQKDNSTTHNDIVDRTFLIKGKTEQLGLEIVAPGIALEREDELEQIDNLVNNLQNVMVLGEAGVGKTQLISGLASRLEKKGKILIAVPPSFFAQGSSGDNARALNKIFETYSPKELKNIVFFMDEIHMIANQGTFGLGEQDHGAPRNLLKPYLTGDGEKRLVVIGATTNKEYAERIEQRDAAFARRFKNIVINPFSLGQMKNILKSQTSVEYFKKIGFKYDETDMRSKEKYEQIMEYSCNLLEKYLPYQQFPKKGFQFTEYLLSGKNINDLTQRDIENAVSKFYKIPLELITKEVNKDSLFLETEKLIGKTIVGQDSALHTISSKMLSFIQSETNAPLSFLSMGSTGIGKTETVEQLSRLHQLPYIKFNMGQYKNAKETENFISSLEQHLRNNYAGIILFDEVEKADPQILDVVLSLLDKGEMGSGYNRVQAKAQMIFFTSNLLNKEIKECREILKKDGIDELPEDLIRCLLLQQTNLRPEFIGRINSVLSYNSLNYDNVYQIVSNLLDKNLEKFEENGVSIKINDADRKIMTGILAKNSLTVDGGVRQIIKNTSEVFEKIFSDERVVAQLKSKTFIGQINSVPNQMEISFANDNLNIIINGENILINNVFKPSINIDKVLQSMLSLRTSTNENTATLKIVG